MTDQPSSPGIEFLKDLVKDWGGFERLVTDMNSTGKVTAQHNVKLTGKSGVPRQIDVLMVHQEGPYEHRIIGECKFWKSEIKRSHVDAMITAVDDLGASKGVIFTTKGFQSGAKEMAAKNRIDLFLIRELTDEEWGLPGRKIHFYLQFFSRSLLKIRVPNPVKTLILDQVAFQGSGANLNLQFGTIQSQTKTLKPDGSYGKNLEEHIEDASFQALNGFIKSAFLLNQGQPCTTYCLLPVNVNFLNPIKIVFPGAVSELNSLGFDLGVRIDQSEINVDRMNNYNYAVAVEDCVNQRVFASSKENDATTAQIQPIASPETNEKSDPSNAPLQNNSIFRVIVRPWFDPKEMDGRQPIPWPVPDKSSDPRG